MKTIIEFIKEKLPETFNIIKIGDEYIFPVHSEEDKKNCPSNKDEHAYLTYLRSIYVREYPKVIHVEDGKYAYGIQINRERIFEEDTLITQKDGK